MLKFRKMQRHKLPWPPSTGSGHRTVEPKAPKQPEPSSSVPINMHKQNAGDTRVPGKLKSFI